VAEGKRRRQEPLKVVEKWPQPGDRNYGVSFAEVTRRAMRIHPCLVDFIDQIAATLEATRRANAAPDDRDKLAS
jgi:hypothetical protein